MLARKGILLKEWENASRYHWVADKIVGTPSTLSTYKVVTHVDIIFSNSSNYTLLSIGPDKKVCGSFEVCSVPLYECLFTKLGVHITFFYFEVPVMNNLKVSPCNFILELGHSY